MQTTSALYKSILAADHSFETRITIDGVGVIPQSQIFSLSSNIELFSSFVAVGAAVSAEVDGQILAPTDTIPEKAQVLIETRAVNDTQQSEWIKKGVFYIDEREQTKNGDGLDVLTFHGFDAMMKANVDFASSTITGNTTDKKLVAEIARQMGVSVDSRTNTIIGTGYAMPLPVGYTNREILGYIAASYVGFFVITDAEKLRLVTLLELPAQTNYLVDNVGNALVFGTGDNATRILV